MADRDAGVPEDKRTAFRAFAQGANIAVAVQLAGRFGRIALSAHHGPSDQLRRGAHRDGEPEEWPKIPGRRHATDEEPGNIGLEMLIQYREAIVRCKSVEDIPLR